MIESIIIEDEKPAARRLERMLERNGIKSLVQLHSVAESINWLKNNPQPDLIFLDIQLSDGLSFEIFEAVNISSAIIFTTAYDQYTLKAFKLNSVDYLLKPIEEEELLTAIHKYKHSKASRAINASDINSLKQLLVASKKEYKTRFMVQVGQHLKLVKTNDIECFYSEDKATYIFTKDQKIHLLDNSLEQITDVLDPKLFFKVNRKFIIHLHAIKDMISYTNNRLQIKLNNYHLEEIIVSREKVKDFKKWLS